MEVYIRKARADDYEALCGLFDEVDALHRNHLPRVFRKPDGPVRVYSDYASMLADECVGVFVADVDAQLAGFVHAVIRDIPALPILVPRRIAIVENLCVSSAYRRRGLARRLMDAVHRWAIDGGATSVELNVYEFNQMAMDIYARLGYAVQSRRMSRALHHG